MCKKTNQGSMTANRTYFLSCELQQWIFFFLMSFYFWFFFILEKSRYLAIILRVLVLEDLSPKFNRYYLTLCTAQNVIDCSFYARNEKVFKKCTSEFGHQSEMFLFPIYTINSFVENFINCGFFFPLFFFIWLYRRDGHIKEKI